MAANVRNKYATLKRVPLFKPLKPATLRELSASAVTMNIPRGHPIFRRGESSAGIYVVLSGSVLLRMDGPGGSHKIFRIVGPPGYMGVAAALLNAPHLTSAEAAGDSRLLLIPRDAVRASIAHSNEFALRLAIALSHTVRNMVHDIEALSLLAGRERLTRYLMQIAVNGATRTRTVTLPAKKSVIASHLNLTPEYFSRVLRNLSECGAIAVHGRHITILDYNLLPDSAAP